MNTFNESEWNEFRTAHPELRFWQAMTAYLYVSRILIEYKEDEEFIYENPFYWKDESTNSKRQRSKNEQSNNRKV